MIKALVITALFLAFGLSIGKFSAQAMERGITPYGDYCPQCSNYGASRGTVTHAKAIASMGSYFHKKGLTIGNASYMGRFIKVDVYRSGSIVDRIIFDRRTGRIRSIY